MIRIRVIFDPDSLPISIATYGHRRRFVHLTVESILRGSKRPSGIYVWVDVIEMKDLPSGLKRLARQGVQVRPLEDGHFGHKKWLGPSSDLESFPKGVVLADDDYFFPSFWFETLWEFGLEGEADIVAWRCKEIKLEGTKVLPYDSWPVSSKKSSLLNVAISGSGTFLGKNVLRLLANSGSSHKTLAPKADDLWVSAVSKINLLPTQRATDNYPDWPQNPMQGSSGLADINVKEGQNDVAIQACLQPVISKLKERDFAE